MSEVQPALKIALTGRETRPPRAPRLPYTAYASRLAAAGFERIVLEGLAALGARDASGARVDRLAFDVAEDAEYLALACEELAHMRLDATPRRHETYLDEGVFEITGLLTTTTARLRVGVFEDELDPDDPELVKLPSAAYFGLWSDVAEALDAAAEGLREPEPLAASEVGPREERGATDVLGDAAAELLGLAGQMLGVDPDAVTPAEAAATLRRLTALVESGGGPAAGGALRELVALLEELPGDSAGPGDALGELLPPPTGWAPETDEERAERLYREAREVVLAAMRQHGVEEV